MPRAAAYVTYTEADSYFAANPDASKWLAVSTISATKTALLLAASDAIDRLLLKGSKVSPSQPRAFPRIKAYTTQLTVPQCVKDACCEEANEMLKQLGTPRLNLQRQNVASVSYTGSSETYRVGAGKGLLSVVARDMLKREMLGAV